VWITLPARTQCPPHRSRTDESDFCSSHGGAEANVEREASITKAMAMRLSTQLLEGTDVKPILYNALDRALTLTGATLGNVQIMGWTAGELTIAAQRGFQQEFLEFFRCVKADNVSACGRALRQRRAIVIKDLMSDRDFTPCRLIAERAGFRSVQSTPIISSGGAFLGILSTHFQFTHQPTECEMHAIRLLADATANAIIARRARLRVEHSADRLTGCIERTRAAIEDSRARLNRRTLV
jgi:GAF domain-containing protein